MGLLAQGASDHPLPLGSVCPPSCFSSCRPWSVSRAVSWASSPSMCPRHPTYCVPQGRVISASPSHLPLCWTISSGTTAGAPSGSQNSNSGPTHLNAPEVSLVVPPAGPKQGLRRKAAASHTSSTAQLDSTFLFLFSSDGHLHLGAQSFYRSAVLSRSLCGRQWGSVLNGGPKPDSPAFWDDNAAV